MKNIFKRSKLNPILKPIPSNIWEARKLYNPGAIIADNKIHLFYRAIGRQKNWHSSIGYAVSPISDGEKFKRFKKPLLDVDKKNPLDIRGLEDPRITKIGKTYYMAYAEYDGITPRLCIATSTDLKKWHRHGPALKNFQLEKNGGEFIGWDKGKAKKKIKNVEWSKSGGIFPQKINGKYYMLFGEFRIWLAKSEDGIHWENAQKPFLKPRKGKQFDNTFVEMGPPPIRTKKGWLVLYHGINEKNHYKIGFLLLDIKNPNKILYRSKAPIFSPKASYELGGLVDVIPGGMKKMLEMTDKELENFLEDTKKHGWMPKVTFCCGAVRIKNKLRIYYGASDTHICTATANINDILNLIE